MTSVGSLGAVGDRSPSCDGMDGVQHPTGRCRGPHGLERLRGRRLCFGGPVADSFIRTEPVSVTLEAEQSEQPTRVVNDGETTSTARLQCGHRILERPMRAYDTSRDGAEVTGSDGARDRLAQIGSFDGGEQLTVCAHDESHVDVIVVKEPPDLVESGIRSMGLADRHHGVGNASSGVFAIAHFAPSAEKVEAAGRSRGGGNVMYMNLATVTERDREHTHRRDPLLVDGFTSTMRCLVTSCSLGN